MRMKSITPVFLMGVLAIAAAIPLHFGVTPESLMGSLSVVALSTLLVTPGESLKRVSFYQLGEVGSVNVEEEYKQVAANLKEVRDQLKAHAETAQKQIDQHQQMSAETRTQVDKLLTTQGELSARLQAAEQALVANNNPGGPSAPETVGQMVTASENYEQNASRIAGAKGAFSVQVNAAVTTTQGDGGSGGYPVDPMRVDGIVAAPERRMTIRDLLAPGNTTSNSVEYVEETGFTNSADVVAENPSGNKPESDLDLEIKQESVATIAHWVHASKQVLSDVPMMQSHIDGRLRYGLRLKEELQLLKGSGVGLNIDGLTNKAITYANPGVTVANQTKIDVLRIAMLQVALAEYSASGIVLSPIDWAEMELAKDANNNYLFSSPQTIVGPTLWGLPVVATPSQDVDNFLVGGFNMAAQIWDREDVTVEISTEDRDNFVKNMVTILAEERLAMTVYRPESLVKGTFTAALA